MSTLQPVSCQGCGETYARHPSSEVPCPQCKAAVGTPCRGHGNTSSDYCWNREVQAIQAGFIHMHCPAGGGANPYSVACPSCQAVAWHRCKRPSEHSGPFTGIHVARKTAAIEKRRVEEGFVPPTRQPGPAPAPVAQMSLGL